MNSSDFDSRKDNPENLDGTTNDANPEAPAEESVATPQTEQPASTEETPAADSETLSSDSPSVESPSAGPSPTDAPTRVSIKDKLGAFASSMSPKKHLHVRTRGRKITAAALGGLLLLGGGATIAHEIYEDYGQRGYHADYREHRPERGGFPGQGLHRPQGGPGSNRWADDRWDHDRWDHDRWERGHADRFGRDDRFDLDDRYDWDDRDDCCDRDDRYDRDDRWDDDRCERWDDDRLERELMERERSQDTLRK